MNRTVLYQITTGWVVINISAYHSWQGHIADVPDDYLGLLFVTKINPQ